MSIDIIRQVLWYKPTTGQFFSVKTNQERVPRTHKHGYGVFNIRGKTYLAHRIAWALSFGQWPSQIDHINCNKLDNRLSNLRIATNHENARNRRKLKPATSKIKGVFYDASRRLWQARLEVNGKKIYLGRFTTEKAAIEALMAKGPLIHGPFWRY